MAKINDGTLRDWNNGDIMGESDYEQEREIIRTAINDNFDRLVKKYEVIDKDGNVKTTQNLDTVLNYINFKEGSGITFNLDNATSTLTVNLTQDISAGYSLALNREKFTATEGQTVFTLTNGSYTVDTNAVRVIVGGSPQSSGSGFTETSSTSITLAEGVPQGTPVEIIFSEHPLAYTQGHNSTHEIGGYDEIDVTKLKNYQEEIAAPLADIATNVKKYGVDPTGVNDSTVAIQNAVNENEVIFIPIGKYKITSTIVIPSGRVIFGAIKADNVNGSEEKNSSFVWEGGDSPMFTTVGFNDPTLSAKHITMYNLGFYDKPTTQRLNYFMLDFFNASYTKLEDCVIVGAAESFATTSTLTGVGFRVASGFTGMMFVNKLLKCKVQNAFVEYHCTDSHITMCELWGTELRGTALKLVRSYNTIVSNNEIVGGINSSITMIEGNGNVITHNYFDGSYYDQETGVGILSTDNVINCLITDNNFWHQKKEAINFNNLLGSTITGNVFADNDYMDRGYDDIVITKSEGNAIESNTFIRSYHWDSTTNTSKEQARTNIKKPISITNGSSDYWSETVVSGNTLRPTSMYTDCVFPSTVFAHGNGHKFFEKVYNSISSTPKRSGINSVVSDVLYLSKGTTNTNDWVKVDNGKLINSSATDFNSITSGEFYIGNVANLTNRPSELTSGNGTVEILQLNSSYLIQRYYHFTTAKLYIRHRDNGTWSAWKGVALA